jgi:hypothetical protein
MVVMNLFMFEVEVKPTSPLRTGQMQPATGNLQREHEMIILPAASHK